MPIKKIPYLFSAPNYTGHRWPRTTCIDNIYWIDWMSPSQRKNMLSKFYKILEPGGSVLLDVYSLNAFGQREETAIYEANLLNGFWSPHRYFGFLNRFKYEKEKMVLDKYTIIEADRTRTFYNWLQYFSPDDLESEFAECGLTVKKLISDVAGSSFQTENMEFTVVAEKQLKISPK